MRILALNWRDVRSPVAGGSEVHLQEILNRLVGRGHEATLICSQFPGAKGSPEDLIDGVQILRVGTWWNAHLTVPRAARALLDRVPFDVVLDDVNKVPFFAPTFSRVPVLALFLHLLGRSVFRETNPLFASLIYLYERRIGRHYRHVPVVAISRSTEAELIRGGLSREMIEVSEPGLDTAFYRPGVSPRDRAPLVLVVSRLKNYKRVDVAIRAFAEIRTCVPAATLAVIGTGDARPALEALDRRLGTHTQFLGAVSDLEKVVWLNRASLVINPSMKEGWGLVGLEAMACGTPVVASDVPGHRDSVVEGAGVLVPYGDGLATARAAIEILTDPARTDAMRERAVGWARRFSWDRTADAFEDALRRAAAGIRTHQPVGGARC